MLLSTNIKPGTTIIIGSDNGTSQYKSENNFFDLLCLADHYECIIIHIYGVAGHGGNAVDTVGGVVKIAIRNAVAWDQSFFNANDYTVFFNDKFETCDSSSYSIKLLHAKKLNEERAEARYKWFPTVKRLSIFQVMIRFLFVIQVWFVWTVLWVYSWNLTSTQSFTTSQYQEYSNDDEIQESLEICDSASSDQTVAIAAVNSSVNTVWFVYPIDTKCVDHSSNNTDDYHHNVPKSRPHLLCQ